MPARLSEEKALLRRKLLAERARVAPEARETAGRALAKALGGFPRVIGARRLGLYAALADEMPTRPSFDALVGAGRECALPAAGSDAKLVFRRVSNWRDLVVGRWGVLTPPAGAPEIAVADLDVVLVPGVAFDADGNRLGRGGGHYDATFAADGPAPLLIGLAWSFQVVSSVPHGSRDRRVDAIVTEEGCVANPGRPL